MIMFSQGFKDATNPPAKILGGDMSNQWIMIMRN
jgi:hypothetical protein